MHRQVESVLHIMKQRIDLTSREMRIVILILLSCLFVERSHVSLLVLNFSFGKTLITHFSKSNELQEFINHLMHNTIRLSVINLGARALLMIRKSRIVLFL